MAEAGAQLSLDSARQDGGAVWLTNVGVIDATGMPPTTS